MTTDASSHDQTTRAFERLDIPLGPFTEPTVVVTEPTNVALPYVSAAAMAATCEPTVVVTETTMAALAAQTAPQNEADPGAKTVPFQQVDGVALPTAPPSAAERAAADAAARRPERAERAERSDRADRSGRIDRADRSGRIDHADRSGRIDRAAAARKPAERDDPQDAGRPIKLGKYQLMRHLASGGTSHVFLARMEGPTGFSRHLVVKTLRREHASDPAHVAAFVDEAWFLSSLHHGNIVQIFDVGASDDGTHYLAMDYLHGETLRTALQQVRAAGQHLPLDFALTAVAGCAEALHYVHTRHGSDGRWLRMVHRDVTPSNLMACYDGAIKLIDFGNAKAATRASHTPAGAIKGETAYMAPEQARGDAVDLRSDVFSLGVVLYELTTRIHPFAERSMEATKQRLLQGDIKAPSQLVAEYPSELSRVVMTALARDPSLRYRDCGALGRALMELAERLELRTGPAAVRQAMTQLFGAKPEAWVDAGAAQAEPPPRASADPPEQVTRRTKKTRPLQPQPADRSAPAAVSQPMAAGASAGVVAARAAALPPATAMVAPSARISAPPPPRLPAASSLGAVAQPPRPERAPKPAAARDEAPVAAAPPMGANTLPASPPPPAVVAAAAANASQRGGRASDGAASFDLVTPAEVQHMVENAWGAGGARPAAPPQQWAEAIAEARRQAGQELRPRARGTSPAAATSAERPGLAELTTSSSSASQLVMDAPVEARPTTSRRGLRLGVELLATAAALALLAGPTLSQLLLEPALESSGQVMPMAAPSIASPAATATAGKDPAPPLPVAPRADAPAAPAPATAAGAPALAAAEVAAPAPAADATPATAAREAAAPTAAREITVEVTSEPSDALVTLDGKRLGKTPLLLKQTAQSGLGALRVRLPGYRVHRAEVARDGDVKLSVKLRQAPAAAAAEEPVPSFMRGQ